MSEEKKSTPKQSESKASDGNTSKADWKTGQNGKGDGARNNTSESFRSNFDAIDWSR